QRERGRFAGRAEHVEPVAAVVEEKSRQRGRAGAVGLASRVDGGSNRGDHAGKSACGHIFLLAARGPLSYRHCEERSDEAIQGKTRGPWIASALRASQ